MHREDGEQMAVVEYLRKRYPNVRFTISPVNLITNMISGIRAKKLGYGPGTPDLLIFEPAGKYHGLFIEMKAPEYQYLTREGKMKKVSAGKPSREQIEWLDDLNKKGYLAYVCTGAREAILVIENYMRVNHAKDKI